jgi:hypothetical protein
VTCVNFAFSVRNAPFLADSSSEASFTAIIDDVVVWTRLCELRADRRSRPLLFVLLMPALDVVREGNPQRRNKDVFGAISTPSPARRLRGCLDTSRQTSEESAEEILPRAWN